MDPMIETRQPYLHYFVLFSWPENLGQSSPDLALKIEFSENRIKDFAPPKKPWHPATTQERSPGSKEKCFTFSAWPRTRGQIWRETPLFDKVRKLALEPFLWP